MVLGNFVNNGIANVVVNYSRKLIEDGIRVDFVVGGEVSDDRKGVARKIGASIVQLPWKKQNPRDYFSALRKVLTDNRYDIVHVHGNSGMVVPDLAIARKTGARHVVCHCHNTQCDHVVFHHLLKRLVPHYADVLIACGRDAGKWLYGSANFAVLPNAFDTSRFRFDPDARYAIRKKLGIARKDLVVGIIARMNPEKNHLFLIRVFEQVLEIRPHAVLVIAGDGSARDTIHAAAQASRASRRILFLGNLPDSSKLYSALDVFALPSEHEGLPCVSLEAQISGIPCLFSEAVPQEACISADMHTIPLEYGASGWAEAIVRIGGKDDRRREADSHSCNPGEFDIDECYKRLVGLYGLSA